MSMLFTRLPVIFLCFFLLMSPAMAAPPAISQQGADKLQALFENIINARKESPSAENAMKYVFDGEVAVEQGDSYYAITLPYVTLENFGLYNLKVGIIAINATPQETPGRWNMAIALPPQLFLSDDNGNTVAHIDIGAQHFAGIWDETLNYLGATNAVYKDVMVTRSDNVTTMRLGELSVKTDGLEKSTPAAFSGAADLSINKLELLNPDLSTTKIGFLKMTSQVEGLEGFWTKTLGEKTGESATSSSLPIISNPPAQLDVRYDVTDFNISRPKAEKPAFAFDDLGLRIKGQELKTDNGMLDIDLNYSGMKAENFMKPLEISDMALAAVITKIPVLQLLAMQENAAQSEGGGLSLMFKVPSVLAQSGTIIRLENSKTVGPDYSGAISAEIVGDITALNAMTIQGGARINYMDNFIKRMRGYNELIAGMLELVQPFANTSGGENDTAPISRFTFTMDKTGKMMVNDQDISKPVTEAAHHSQEAQGGKDGTPEKPATTPTSTDTAPAR